MSDNPRIILSAFADEAANHKSAIEQMSVMAAIGLSYYSPRFIDVHGNGHVSHVVELNKSDLKRLTRLHAEYGMHVASIGARIGKVKLCDVDDGTGNVYVPLKKYLRTEVAATIRVAHALGTKLIRGFSFYHPRGTEPMDHMDQVVDQIGTIVDKCAKEGLVYGLEIEPNLVGETGQLLEVIATRVNHPSLVLVFDGGNIASQNKNPITVYEEYRHMRRHIGWMHVKDYSRKVRDMWTGQRGRGPIDEEKLKHFVPPDVGDAAHEFVLRNLREHLPRLNRRMKRLGAPGFFLEVEPHLKGGGQFGGFSGPDGIGVAVRALCSVLDYVSIDYDLRSFDDIRRLRGF